MRAIICVFIFFPVALIGQISQGHVLKKLKNGTGVIIEYGNFLVGYEYSLDDHPDTAKISAIKEYKNNRVSGKFIQFFNYPSDTASVLTYKDDTLNGPFYFRYRDGRLWQHGVYKDGIVLGRKDVWLEDGTHMLNSIVYDKKKSVFYIDGKPANGERVIYSSSSYDTFVHIFFHEGKIDSVNSYTLATSRTGSEAYKDNHLNYIFYYEKGDVEWETKLNYIDGTRKAINYYEKGNIWSIFPGKISSIYPNKIDSLQGELFFSDNDSIVYEGRYVTYYHNMQGKIESEGYYKDNRKVGDWKYYNEKGRIDSTQVFENDKLIKTIIK